MKTYFQIALSTLIILIFSFNSFAQTPGKGKITGKVFDKNTNEPMIGLAVAIEGTTIAVPTNFDGQYEFSNLAPGTYKLLFRYVAYNTKVIENVVVTAGKVTNLDVQMEESAQQMQEVVVTSSFKKESIGALYTIQKNNIA